ncbi:S8 family peptidase [Streptomyces sp. NBC_01077]|uniref:S8 family serine peptidase n=1 Tax=Streptomyces sp. NBC_01077 TaxID=2903746 RepID=UPI00386991A5|nr:S8 family peptidase [Streptomyces sp. NBC_01077]
MAAPHVAGAFAVLRQAYPDKSVTDLQTLLKTSGRPISYTGATTRASTSARRSPRSGPASSTSTVTAPRTSRSPTRRPPSAE